MKFKSSFLLLTWLFVSPCWSEDAARVELNREQVHQAATNSHSLFLDPARRIEAVDTFLKIVQIKGASGHEESVGREVQHLIGKSARPFTTQTNDGKAPLNLVLELPASKALIERRGILLNAHLDTIQKSTPDLIAFDSHTGDFYHQHESDPAKVSSFGGDDRSAVAVIVEAVRILEAKYWKQGVAHRRIVLVFTADEERGCVGAKYLSKHEPAVFENLEVSLSIDGPLDLRTDYPRDSFVVVSLEADRNLQPYSQVLKLLSDFCQKTNSRFGQTTYGLGMGDFAYFPRSANAGLHLRSPVRGWHNKERVKVQDLINQIDLVCYFLLGMDDSLPVEVAR